MALSLEREGMLCWGEDDGFGVRGWMECWDDAVRPMQPAKRVALSLWARESMSRGWGKEGSIGKRKVRLGKGRRGQETEGGIPAL